MNKFFGKIKLKWRVFGFLLGFCLLLLVILWLFQVTLLDDFYRRIRIAETRNDVATIIDFLYEEDFQQIVAQISSDGDFIADVVDMDGVSLLPRTRPGSQDISANLALINAARDNGGEYFRFHMTVPQSLEPERPLSDTTLSRADRQDNRSERQSSGRSGSRGSQSRRNNISRSPVESFVYIRLAEDRAVIINAVVTPVFATTITLRYQLYAISAIMIVLSAALAIIIAKRISKPIEEINSSAMNLAKGNYDTRFNGKGFKEIVGLSETLNTAATELGRTEALRRELLANVSHDLRTPVSLIYSYAEMMHDFPDDITPEQTEVIMEETKRLTGLLNDVLDISKLEAGAMQLNITEYNLTKDFGETIQRLQELLKKENYIIDFTHGEDIIVKADELKLNRAFYNLLVNAVHFAGDDLKVTVNLEKTDKSIKVSVTDHGEGILEEELPLIWDRYYKSGKAHKRAVTGTGLGLSIVKKIIQLHGGTCGVLSEPGKGSTFWFEI